MQLKKSNNPNLPTRLAKRMSELGICSRREADTYILNGWVSVNGEVITQKGYKVFENDRIQLSEQAKTKQRNKITIIINKPVGFVSSQPEKDYQAAVALITPENHWKGDKSGIKFHKSHTWHLAPAGRLDIDSNGLLVLTQNGAIAKQLIGSKSKIEKEYLVRVDGSLDDKGLALLNYGLSLDGEQLRPATVVWQNENQLNFKLKQGKKRQIRRMCALVGLQVMGLKRVRIGQVVLGKLPQGQWRYLAENESF